MFFFNKMNLYFTLNIINLIYVNYEKSLKLYL